MHTRIPGVSKRSTLSLGAGALLSLSFVLAACSIESEPTPPDETGGSGGLSGGAGGAGGTAGSLAGSGGTPQAGTGGAGTGGFSGSGGQGGSTAGQGGSAGQGGTAATSGAAGSIASGAGGVANGGLGGMPTAGQGGIAGSAGSMGGFSGMGGAGMGGAASGAGGAGNGGMAGQAGGGGGASGFAPCPAGMPCKILPLGDSITDGIGFSGGYRVELFSLALADDHDITYVGGSMNGPQMVDGQPFPRAHEGHSGWTISEVDDIVPSPALGPDPNIILLHIGTNDMSNESAGATDRLETLVDAILADQPNALLVVSSIIPLPFAANAVNTFNAAVPGIVSERASAGKHIVYADQFTGFPTSELGDNVHPNQAGYERMARVWYEAISDYL